MKNFIGIYDNYIMPFECDKLITLFEKQQEFKRTFTREASEKATVTQKKDSQLFCHRENMDIWLNEVKPLVMNFDIALKHYETNTGICDLYGVKEFNYTEFKIQKTLPSEGYHVWHLEHASPTDMSKRVLAFIVYLNDIEEGGETEFLHQSCRVKAKKGRIVIWPTGFPYAHRGNPPLSGAKYIFTSWLKC